MKMAMQFEKKTQARNSSNRIFFWFAAIPLLAVSCQTFKTQEERLSLRQPAADVRLDDIKRHVEKNPVKAIDLIGVYREAYRVLALGEKAEGESGAETEALAALETAAVENLRKLQAQAVAEERWEDAASYSRSLASMAAAEDAGVEADFILVNAKKNLSGGSILAAFLGAVQAHELRPLSFDDALLFLERAVQVKQRRAAAFFYAACGGSTPPGGRQVPAELRDYAQGSDTVAAMVRGVATVQVDRGIKIERGRGFADKVLGSAFFVDSSGLLITNYHVISSEVDPKYEGYSRMYIRLGDSSSPRYPAKMVGWDKALDLALIKTEYQPEFVFSVVDRVIPQVGDTVLAIGSPGGLEKTVTSGIVSALSRRFLQIGDVIQIDAAINPGNSGGPVVDSSGRLLGIAFAGIEQYPGLNFAVPAERLAAALPAMIQGGKAERPWLGLALSETASGAEIIYTAPNTPAAGHRIQEGALIKKINGREVTAPQGLLIPALQDSIFQSRPGELVSLETAGPNGEISRRVIMTTARPEFPLLAAAKLDSRERLAAPLFGMILSPGQGKFYSSAYLVKKVVRGSIADEAGISGQDPISIRGFRVLEKEGFALMEISIKKRSMGYLETNMPLVALLDSPDTL
ncbi:MAG: trypsin-like peptidase domain-containing protein [Treponema sp.]|jgi:S1-C subfamily serine protease|nr:trypsin-like peptidase domain-containing protein [Treponema sp.]